MLASTMDGDAQRSAWLENLESGWRRELRAQRTEVEELWRTPLAERLSDGNALRISSFRITGNHQLLVVPVDADACRFREGDFLCLSQDHPLAPTGKFIHLGEDDDGLHLWRWWGEMPDPGSEGWVLDRDFVDLSDRYEQATRALAETVRGREKVLPFLLGDSGGEMDGGLFTTTMDEFEDEDAPRDVLWHDSQQDAIAACVATHDGYLVQGPPGTGKTFVLAEVVRRLVGNGERVLVTGPTHRAIQHALEGCRRLLPDSVRVVKIGPAMLARGDIEHFETFADSGLIEEADACVVGATPFALWSSFTGLREVEFDTVVIDEASQVTVMIAVMAMLHGERWLFFGDDCQLPPVMISGSGREAAESSIFRLLKNRGFETMLEETWRLNEQLAAWPSATFYGGRLTCRTNRRLLLDPPPSHPVLLGGNAVGLVLSGDDRATVRSEAEAQTVVDLVRELVRGGVGPGDIGVITPFRAQAAAIRAVLRIPAETASLHRLVTVDTVERFQGQEREVILVSLAAARPEWVRHLAGFLFQPERWNVAVTRARRKLIVVASRGLLDAAESLADGGDPGAVCFSSWHREVARSAGITSETEGGG
ncbi:DEAD/DEAH box helicase [Haloferula sp. A504]|uniref:DEAD/DEAH box helicase n=1 Tax=Haloferula sp. A504 TaxID=3373601 RepID=UPI0031CA5C67|nr:AAA domain-containing protein [Verrucomicrobiaceae bacterium E54]